MTESTIQPTDAQVAAAAAAAAAAQAAAQTAAERKRAKLDVLRMARETLTENSRSLPVGTREITAADIKTFAEELMAYVDAD